MGAITKQVEQLCPLCGGDNLCAVAAGQIPSTCWCARKAFPAELLNSETARSNPSACICQGCLERVGHER